MPGHDVAVMAVHGAAPLWFVNSTQAVLCAVSSTTDAALGDVRLGTGQLRAIIFTLALRRRFEWGLRMEHLDGEFDVRFELSL